MKGGKSERINTSKVDDKMIAKLYLVWEVFCFQHSSQIFEPSPPGKGFFEVGI